MTADRRIHRAAGDRAAVHDGKIFSFDLACLKRPNQFRARSLSECHHQQPARVLIQTMHNTGARQSGYLRKPMQQSIRQCPGGVPGAGMHYPPCRLIDHRYIRVLINHWDGYRLRQPVQNRQGRHFERYDLTAINHESSGRDTAIQCHTAFFEPSLQLRPRIRRENLRQHFIQPLP